MNNENLIPITIRCEICHNPFETLFVVSDGCPYDYCCSMQCYDTWGSPQYIRDRKLISLLK
jgi:hypothetical protein